MTSYLVQCPQQLYSTGSNISINNHHQHCSILSLVFNDLAVDLLNISLMWQLAAINSPQLINIVRPQLPQFSVADIPNDFSDNLMHFIVNVIYAATRHVNPLQSNRK